VRSGLRTEALQPEGGRGMGRFRREFLARKVRTNRVIKRLRCLLGLFFVKCCDCLFFRQNAIMRRMFASPIREMASFPQSFPQLLWNRYQVWYQRTGSEVPKQDDQQLSLFRVLNGVSCPAGERQNVQKRVLVLRRGPVRSQMCREGVPVRCRFA